MASVGAGGGILGLPKSLENLPDVMSSDQSLVDFWIRSGGPFTIQKGNPLKTSFQDLEIKYSAVYY